MLYSTYSVLRFNKSQGGRLKKPLRAFTSSLPEGNKRSSNVLGKRMFKAPTVLYADNEHYNLNKRTTEMHKQLQSTH